MVYVAMCFIPRIERLLMMLYISILFLLFSCWRCFYRLGSCETTEREEPNTKKKPFQSQINHRRAGSQISKWICVEFGQDVSWRGYNAHRQGQRRNEKIRCQSV
jgi:hypothetical protein